MRPRHSHSLLLVWQVAEAEARRLHTEYIEPNHLLIGLCKIVDVDLPALVTKENPDRDGVLEELLREVRRVRTVLHNAGVDACKVRRLLRRACEGSRDVLIPKGRLHRTQASKDIFADGEQIAEMTNSPVYPIHLLYALISSKDIERENMLGKTGVDTKRLLAAVRDDVLHVPRGFTVDHNLN